MADVTAASAYDARRQVRVLTALVTVLNLHPHIAIWVLYLTEFRDISLAQVGIMEGIFWGFTLALEIPSGAFADRFGRRFGFALGITMEAVGVFIFALAGDFSLLMVSYVLWGSGIAFRSGNDGAFLYDALAADGRSEEYADRFGAMHAAMRFATSGGAIAGGAIAGATDLQIAVFAGFATYLISIPALLALREPPRSSTASVGSYLGTLTAAWRLFQQRPALRYIVLLEIALTMSGPIWFVLFQPFLRGHGIPLVLVGVLIVPIELSSAGAALLSGRAVRRFGMQGVGLIAIMGTVGGLATLATVDHVAALAAFALPQMAFGIFVPAVSAYINTRATSDVRATVLSAGPFGHALMFAVIAPLAGVAGDVSLRLAFGVTALLILVTAGPLYLLWRRADQLPPPSEVDTVAGG